MSLSPNAADAEHRQAIVEYFDLVDLLPSLDAGDPRLGEYLARHAPDVRVTRGNFPAIEGRATFETILSMPTPVGAAASKHHIHTYVREGDRTALEMTIDYTRPDGQVVTIPCASVLRFEGELIASLNIYLDDSPVHAPAAS